jgi:hypothetical protein
MNSVLELNSSVITQGCVGEARFEYIQQSQADDRFQSIAWRCFYKVQLANTSPER